VNILNLKKFLKAFKLNESTISMVLGAVVIVVVGILVVNYFKKTDQGEIVPSATTEKEQVAKIGEKHTVQKGETLWSIAQDAYGSGYNWVDIAEENGLTNPGDIAEGQELSIPSAESKLATIMEEETKTEVQAEADTTKISGASYTVVKGDSLWNIAVRAYGDGYKWVEIARENNLKNPNLIHSGNVLTLPR
jgi:putative chitinase